MKKICSLLLTLALLLACFSGCSYGRDTMATPQPPIYTPEGTEVTLRILTEDFDGISRMPDLIEEIAEKYSAEHENVTIEIEVLPFGKDDGDRDAFIEQMRVAIMAGKGPDVYLFPTSLAGNEMLFNDLKLNMQNGIFREISAYYEADEELHKEELNQTVMDAGTYGKARYILPLRYDFPVLAVNQENMKSYGLTVEDINTTDKLIKTVLESQDQVLVNAAYIDALYMDYFFPQFVDYENREVLVTDDEIATYLKQYQEWYNRFYADYWSDDLGYAGPSWVKDYKYEESSWINEGYPFNLEKLSSVLDSKMIAKVLDEDIEMYPLYSADGSLIAHIEYWGAVGSNCEYPDIAYDFLREFLSREAQWELDRDPIPTSTSSGFYEDGIPVRNKGSVLPLVQVIKYQVTDYLPTAEDAEERSLILQAVTIEESDIPVWDAEIDEVRFASPRVEQMYSEISRVLFQDSNPNVDYDEMAKEFEMDLRYLMAEG